MAASRGSTNDQNLFEVPERTAKLNKKVLQFIRRGFLMYLQDVKSRGQLRELT